jgi:cytochrome P450
VLTAAIMNVNKSEEVWGPDAKSFNPDRFDVGGIPAKSYPGVYGNLLTFLGGARNCVGYRFALAEMKIMMFVIIRTFAFEELASKPKIEQKSR